MSKRRQARQMAVQFLYQNDLKPSEDFNEELKHFWGLIEKKKDLKKYAEELIQGVIEHRKELDEWIQKCVENWDFKRILAVDKNILRLALFEMKYREDVPPVAAINEAIEIAKSLGGSDSKKFVNGVLDKAKEDLKRSLR